MAVIQHFKEINDYTKILNLNYENKIPDFLIYNYENVNHDGYQQLSAYRHDFFEIAFELNKGCSIKVDQFELPSVKNRLALVSPHRLQTVMVNGSGIETQYKGFGLFFKREFINSDPLNFQFFKDFPFFSHTNSPMLSIANDEIPHVVELMNKIQYEYEKNEVFSKEIIKNYLSILFFKAKKHYQKPSGSLKGINREQEIFQEFEYLVQNHFMEMTSVKEYADKLHISAKHLSETIKKVTGENALHFIHKSQINYAKGLLLQTNKTVSEIAYELNFEYPDYFSVFFKRLTGKSPMQFRVS